jgi:hypothetical protein
MNNFTSQRWTEYNELKKPSVTNATKHRQKLEAKVPSIIVIRLLKGSNDLDLATGMTS